MTDCPRCKQPEQYGCECTIQEMYYWRGDRIEKLEAEMKWADEISNIQADRIEELEKELAKGMALDEAMRSWLSGEPSQPPTTGKTPRALQAEVTRLTKALDTAAIKAREKCDAKQHYSLGQACYDAIQHLKGKGK